MQNIYKAMHRIKVNVGRFQKMASKKIKNFFILASFFDKALVHKDKKNKDFAYVPTVARTRISGLGNRSSIQLNYGDEKDKIFKEKSKSACILGLDCKAFLSCIFGHQARKKSRGERGIRTLEPRLRGYLLSRKVLSATQPSLHE
jgi:hypothetical protein